MALRLGARVRNLLRHQSSPPSRVAPSLLDPANFYEEERSPRASANQFYSVRIGDIFHDRYQIAAKLGWGAASTVWLAKDLYRWPWQREGYVAVKVPVSGREENSSEIKHLRLMAAAAKRSGHPGSRYVRALLDTFTLASPSGGHECMVFEALRDTLSSFGKSMSREGGVNLIPTHLLPKIVRPLLEALDFLHSECHTIHTDLKPANIMLAFSKSEGQPMLHAHAKYEHLTPLPQRHHEDGRVIYLSHNRFGPITRGVGRPVLIDFDVAMCGNSEVARLYQLPVPALPNGEWSHEIQAEGLRAPEVVVGALWSYSADMWNLGTLLLHLVEGRDIFRDSADGKTNLARMVACLGPMPEALLQRRIRPIDDAERTFKIEMAAAEEGLSFESFVTRVDGEEKAQILGFVRRLLKWMPHERATAKELIDDPWLKRSVQNVRAVAEPDLASA